MKFKNLNNKYTLISIYVIVTAVIIYSLSRVADSLPVILGGALERLSWLMKVINPVILGFILAYLIEPMVSFFQRQFLKIKFLRGKEKRCRGFGTLTTVFLLAGGILFMVSLLVFSVTDQLRLANFDDFIVLCNEYLALVNDFSRMVMDKLSSLNIESVELSKYVQEAGSYIIGAIQSLAKGFVGSVGNISSYLTTFVFGIIICIYFLIDGKMMISYLRKVCYALIRPKWNKRMKSFLDDADMVFSGYIRGQLMDALVMMVLISIVLSLVGVKFAIVIGVCAGIGNLIPYCGPFVAYAGTILICLLNGQYKQLFIGVILLFIIQAIDGNVIGPKLLSKSINVHPLLVIVSLFFGSAVGGLLGMLFAVPVGAFIKVLFVKFIDSRSSQRTSNPEPVKEEE